MFPQATHLDLDLDSNAADHEQEAQQCDITVVMDGSPVCETQDLPAGVSNGNTCKYVNHCTVKETQNMGAKHKRDLPLCVWVQAVPGHLQGPPTFEATINL